MSAATSISPRGAAILAMLAERKAAPVSDLATLVNVGTKHSRWGLAHVELVRLRERGLVLRIDGRPAHWRLTHAGRAAIRRNADGRKPIG
jgi:hypothetical protein